MNIDELDPPRSFSVGVSGITLQHCADVRLEPDEMITFVTLDGHEYDVVRKSWGYYALPSIEKRLSEHGFRAALVRSNGTGHSFVVLVENDQIEEWRMYAKAEGLFVVSWLDELT